MGLSDAELRALSKWQGKIDAIIKGLNHNDDDLHKQINHLEGLHVSCREQVLHSLTKLQAGATEEAKHEAKKWAIRVGIASGAISGTIGFITACIIFFLSG